MSRRPRPLGDPRKRMVSSTDVALGIEVRRADTHDVVTVTGELDVATVDRLSEVLSDPGLCGRPRLVVDLTELRLLSASGLRTLLAARADCETDGRSLVLVCGDPASVPRRVLEITGLLRVFEVTDSVAAATAARPPS